MKAPLDQFAERIVRNNELEEFIMGLIEEHHVQPSKIMDIAQKALDDQSFPF